MGMTIEIIDQDYQYCLDYVNGKTHTLALNNMNRIIKVIAGGTQYETRLKADMVAMLEELNLEIDEMFARRIDYTVDKIQDLIQQKINSLKENKDEK